jgi:suppressor of tumorigenicity protein 13
MLDFDAAGAAKDEAADAKSNGDYNLAVEKLSIAMTLGPVSAMTLASRAECLLKLRRPTAAVSDCTAAIALNPDSAKALRCRGKAFRFLGKWEESRSDLAAAQVRTHTCDCLADCIHTM